MPNRILKDSIRTSKSINSLTDFQFRLWAYLITYVDDYGRGRAELDILKGFVFPRRPSATEDKIKAALNDLANIGLIHLYEVDGDLYLCLRNWEKHQNRRATASKYPAPPDVDSICEQMQADANTCSQVQADANTCSQVQADANTCSQVQADSPDTRYSILDTRNTILDTRDNDQARENDTDAFDAFWKVYPRKVSKQTALKAWKAAKLDRIVDEIIADVQRRCETEWKGEEMQYIPHPTTYIHQRRWEDETPPQERKEKEKAKNGARGVYISDDDERLGRADSGYI